MVYRNKFLKRFFKIFICFTLLAFVFGCASSLKPKPVFKSKKGIYHKVKKGETLWRIAKTYNINLKKLKRINHIANVRSIKPGTMLFIPGAKKTLKVKPPSPSIRKGFFMWPLKGKLTSRYGIRNKQKHDGIDIAAPKGSPIYAAASGKVIFSGWGPTGYGQMVIIKHNKKLVTVYAHNSKNLVTKNQTVRKGKKIAYVGSTGRASGPHLHFELRVKREPVNPINYLR